MPTSTSRVGAGAVVSAIQSASFGPRLVLHYPHLAELILDGLCDALLLLKHVVQAHLGDGGTHLGGEGGRGGQVGAVRG